MSTRAGSTKKTNCFNEATESQYDPYTDYPVSEYFSFLPWPEWNDADLNCEVWEETKGKPSSTGSKVSVVVAPFYEDPNPPKLPLGVREYVSSWKRPHEVFPGSNLNVYSSLNEPFGLSVPSPVAQCDFFKCMCEIVDVLCRYASTEGFQVEMESGTFVPTTLAEPWRPWHHIYALTKAGKGQIHKPLYSYYGKYVVRLFHFGCWRKLTIDDRIPCDKYGLCMLPVTQFRGELWPILLAKGLLKIISLTGSTQDFSIVSCLTGWISGQLTTGNKTPDQLWRRFQVLIPRFELGCDEAEAKNFEGSAGGRVQTVGSHFGKFCVLVASLGGFAPEEGGLNDVNVIVTMNRDLPLVKANRREGTKSWKRFRWVHWASEKGIWTDELLLPPYRRLQYVSFVKELGRVLSPDPLQEATLYDFPVEDSFSRSTQRLGSGDEEPFEPSQWCDFYKFYEYLVNLNVFLKPSSFSSNLKITCVRNECAKKDGTTPATAKTVTKMEPQNEYFYSPDLTPTQNQPLILYCESSSGISICFSLSVCPSQKKSFSAYLDSQQPEVLKVGNGTLILERHDWRTLQQGEMIGFTKTVGNCSVLVNLKPGRHVLKLWLNCDSPYLVNMFSNVELILHKGPKIRYQLVNESDRILDYISNVSNAFIGLCLKFGKSDLPSALKDFYTIIKPGNDASLLYHQRLDKFIQTFLNCIMSALKSLIPNTDEVKIMLGALRSLFLNPDIDCDLPPGQPTSLYGGPGKKPIKKVVVVLEERTLSQILAYPWTPEEINQVITIQRIFRGYRIRLLFKYQTPARKEFKPYADKLKKICDTLFVPAKRDVEVGKIIRMVVVAQPDLLTTFKFHLDFPNVLDVEEFAGKITGVEPFAWIPLARFIIAHHSPDSVPCAFYLSCNLQQFVVEVIDNDTNDPVFSLANTVSPCYYPANAKGYTVFVFGWNEASPKTVNWRLELVKMKHFDSMHLCNTMMMNPTGCHPYPMPNIEVNEIKNFYVPNRRSRMCRCTIKVRKRSLLTLRLSASYPEARFVLTIALDERHWNPGPEEDFDPVVLKRFSTNGAAFLPSIVLENVQRNACGDDVEDEDGDNGDFTLYLLEAHVLDDSWPLTKQEWGTVEPMRVNPDTWKDLSSSMSLKKGPSESRKKITRMSKRSLQEKNVDNPCWVLQVLTDSSDGDATEGMVVEEDRSYQDSVRAMKVLWEEKNPGRRKKGRDMRVKFLQEMYLEKRLRQLEEEKEMNEAEGEAEMVDQGEDFKDLLHKMTSFSYLTSDKSKERFSLSPRVRPWMPTQELLSRYKREWTEATKESESLESCNTRGKSRSIADEEEEDRREFLTTCNHYRVVMANYLAEEQKQSNELMEQAYKQRLKAIQRMLG